MKGNPPIIKKNLIDLLYLIIIYLIKMKIMNLNKDQRAIELT